MRLLRSSASRPAPTGSCTWGHALSALIGFERARTAGGRFLLRIEDIDLARARPHYVSGIFEDLAWLGLTWEKPVAFQSRRFEAYRSAAGRLHGMGLLYPCFATRSEIEAATQPGRLDPDGAPLYPGLFKNPPDDDVDRRKAAGEPFALRIDMHHAIAVAAEKLGGRPLTFAELGDDGEPSTVKAQPELWGDAVIIRKDIPASYHLAVVVDDAWQGVTHVTRGLDLYASTHIHRLLQVLLDLPSPTYHHHRLIKDETGRKLAKSARDTSLRSLREQGTTPAGVRRMIGLA
jgi:glutamyl-Q tRNA(Asp) synthetase